MTPALSPSLEPVAESPDLPTTVATTQRSSWYDPDASAWEPQPPALFEALRASTVRPPVGIPVTAERERGADLPRRP